MDWKVKLRPLGCGHIINLASFQTQQLLEIFSELATIVHGKTHNGPLKKKVCLNYPMITFVWSYNDVAIIARSAFTSSIVSD